MTDLLTKLEGGDRRSIGRVDEVIAQVKSDPLLFDELINGMTAEDPIVRMRAADAAEKLTADHPEWLQPYKALMLEEISFIEQQEVRWHWAQMIPRVLLSDRERQRVVEILTGLLDDNSSIVRTFSLQALVDLAMEDRSLLPQVRLLVEGAVEGGSPAMRSRGRRLLEQLDD